MDLGDFNSPPNDDWNRGFHLWGMVLEWIMSYEDNSQGINCCLNGFGVSAWLSLNYYKQRCIRGKYGEDSVALPDVQSAIAQSPAEHTPNTPHATNWPETASASQQVRTRGINKGSTRRQQGTLSSLYGFLHSMKELEVSYHAALTVS